MKNVAKFSALALVLAATGLFFAISNWEVVQQSLIELLFVGRIPGTDTLISFEALAGGVIFGLWLIITYKIYYSSITQVSQLVKTQDGTTHTIEEIAL